MSQGVTRVLQMDIVSSLKIAFTYNEESLRLYLYNYLSDMLQKTCLESDAVNMLCGILLSRVKKYLGLRQKESGRKRWFFDIVSCFEDNGTEDNPNICLRDSVTELFKCFFTLGTHLEKGSLYDEVYKIFIDLCKQLSKIDSLCKMLSSSEDSNVDSLIRNHKGKQKEKISSLNNIRFARCKDSSITPHLRLSVLVPLYEIMIQLIYNNRFKLKKKEFKCLYLFEIYSVIIKLQSTFQRGKSKVVTYNILDDDTCFLLTKNLCSQLEEVIPLVRNCANYTLSDTQRGASLTSLDQILGMINWFIEKPQNQDIMQSSFMKVAIEVERDKHLLDILDNPSIDHNFNNDELLCLKLLIVTRYVLAVYETLHPWKPGRIPDSCSITSYSLLLSMEPYIDEQRFHKIEKKMATRGIISSIRTKCVMTVYNLFNKCRFVEDKTASSALSGLLLYLFGNDLIIETMSARSNHSKRMGKKQSSYSFKDLIVYFCMHLDKEMKTGCSNNHFCACIRAMSALASVYPPNKEPSSSLSVMPLINHVTTKRSKTIHKACKILERILKRYSVTRANLIKAALTFMLTFSQTERALERCNQIITTCLDKYNNTENENQNMNICVRDECAVGAILCVLTYFESLLVSNTVDDTDKSSELMKLSNYNGYSSEHSESTDKNMENIKQMVASIDKIIQMVFENEATRKVFHNTKSSNKLEKKIENLLNKLCRYTINNCKLLRQELSHAAKRAFDDKDDISIPPLIKIISFRTENYYSICKLLSRMQYYRGSILTSDDRESFSVKYANLISSCEKLTVEIRALFDKYKDVQKAFHSLDIADINLLHKLATTEIELLIQDEFEDQEIEEAMKESEDEFVQASNSDKQRQNKEYNNMQRVLKQQRQITLKRSRAIEEQLISGEHMYKKHKPSRKRLRSRNCFIDYHLMMQEGYESDAFADLEDFIDTSTWDPNKPLFPVNK
jgi:hypothetical protein